MKISVTKEKIISHKKTINSVIVSHYFILHIKRNIHPHCGQSYGGRKDVITLTWDERTF